MALYGLTGVSLNEQGRVTWATMQQANGSTNAWIGYPYEYQANEIAERIAGGDIVYSIFLIPGGTVLGPKLRNIVFPDGSNGIELEESIPGRRLPDLILR